MKKLITALFIILNFAVSAYAQTQAIPVEFTKHGGGQWIYCNNPEFLTAAELSTDENPEPKYLMKNEDLKPDRYQVFFCFYNWTDFNIEPDIEFITDSNAEIKINSIGYYIPTGSEYFDCIGAWSDYMNIKIRTANGLAQYVPYEGEGKLPAGILLNNSNEWISKYIYNYDVIPPRVTFNMLVDFEILSGTADVNFAALKTYIPGDRSHHCADAKGIEYRNDTSVKGIEPDSLPIVESELNINITPETVNGERQRVIVYNPYYPEGSEADEWVTNINVARDSTDYCRAHAVDSDMLSLHYTDDKKLDYYGEKVEEKDNEWIFDTHHYNLLEYRDGLPWKSENHVPNSVVETYFPTNHNWHFNLGNFGVTNRYNLTITNDDSVMRTVNYTIAASYSSNIVIVRDENGKMLNPYTLTAKNPIALCKGINDVKTGECLFSAEIQPGETKKYILDIILPTNCYGGMTNYLEIDDHKYLKEVKLTDFPRYTEYHNYENTFFNGTEYMNWNEGKLYRQRRRTALELPKSTKKIFANREQEIRIVKTPSGYAARFAGWDGYSNNLGDKSSENKLYLFDKNFNYTDTLEFNGYIEKMAYAADCTYILCGGKKYISTDGRSFKELNDGYEFPVNTSMSAVYKKDGVYNITKDSELMKLSFESNQPEEIKSAGDVYYCIRSMKTRDDDTETKNIISVSADCVNWTDITLPDRVLYLKDVQYIDGILHVYGKYEAFEFDNVIPKDNIKVLLNGEYLSYEVPAKVINDRTMIPLRYTFEKLGAKVDWVDETKEIIVNDGEIKMQIGSEKAYAGGTEYILDTPPVIDNDKTIIPIRFIAENLGYKVDWEQESQTAIIESLPKEAMVISETVNTVTEKDTDID